MVAKTGIVYLQKDKLQLYSPNLASIVEFRFVPEIVRDLDIVNKSLLENLIKTFVTNGKILPSSLIFILADNAYFTKDFLMQVSPGKTPEQSQQQINVSMENVKAAAEKYIEHVPYDNVVSKTFPLKNGLRLCAVNQDFYEAIKGAFERANFTVESVIPGLVLGNNISAKPVMDAAMAVSILQRASTLKQYDLLTQQTFVPESDKPTDNTDELDIDEQQSKKPNKKRLIAMIALLAVLLIVLVIVIIQSQTPPKPKNLQSTTLPPVAASQTTAKVVATTAPAVVVSSPTPGVEQSVREVSVSIGNSGSNATVAQSLRTSLIAYGFKSVVVQATSSVRASGALVSFASSIPQGVRNAVLIEVRKINPNVSVQERQSLSPDISIVL